MSTEHLSLKYGTEPGWLFYTHISDQYAPFNSQVINVGGQDAPCVLDGLLYHESDLRIAEHCTDMAGFTEHLFAVMLLLNQRFVPRIRDLSETKLYAPGSPVYEALHPCWAVCSTYATGPLRSLLRLATAIKQGTITTLLTLRKPGNLPQNELAVALCEPGRIKRSFFFWTSCRASTCAAAERAQQGRSPTCTLARVVFFHWLGEIQDWDFKQYSCSRRPLYCGTQ